eukprot:CAMPEP_0115854552 /NCGR_PEP_ID=MMETSP0287-20121206/14083_1 /TAXON_ID=412157 /ORGANISM="Chrysochromulina rotalis, Strain UIO044" /LENGTH=204 /DNA_ID=CAMNT_0003308673 /DNA_START=133 /DNA_END=747 /DNA_ORIENTATION=+
MSFAERTARFIRISEAYETLSNGDLRAVYDAKLRKSRPSFTSHRDYSSGSTGSHTYEFTFSLKDALAILERFMGSQIVESSLGARYALAKAALAAWPGYAKPLPELLRSDLMRSAIDQVDWAALRATAKQALSNAFENEDGSVDWFKVATAGAAGAAVIARALDATDDGNRTARLTSAAGNAMSWLSTVLGSKDKSSDRDKDES